SVARLKESGLSRQIQRLRQRAARNFGFPIYRVGKIVEVAVADRRGQYFGIDGIRADGIPAKHPDRWLASGKTSFVDPALHLASGTEYVADIGHPVGIGHQAGAALRSIAGLRGIVDPAARLIVEGCADSA